MKLQLKEICGIIEGKEVINVKFWPVLLAVGFYLAVLLLAVDALQKPPELLDRPTVVQNFMLKAE